MLATDYMMLAAGFMIFVADFMMLAEHFMIFSANILARDFIHT